MNDGVRPLLSIAQAFQRLRESLAPLPTETVPLRSALGRVLGEAVAAACDLPPFDQSSMDGYAARAADLAAGGPLPLAGTIAAMAHSALPKLAPGTTARIYTGGLLPIGADTVVQQELAERAGDSVRFREALPAGANVRRRGEELRAGTRIAEAGLRVTPGLIGACGAANVATLRVRRAPRIRLLVSGDEIAAPGSALRPGEVADANGPLLDAWFRAQGYVLPAIVRVLDEPEAVRSALQAAFEEADLIVSSGGVSVGDRDLIGPQAEALGAERLFWKIAQKPGKPLFAARRGGSLLMGLPGNPASVLVNLASFVRLALDTLEGLADPGPRLQAGVLAADAQSDAHREVWLRARAEIGADGVARLHPLPHQASHMLSNLVAANALVWLPTAEGPLPAGTVVRWLALG